MPANKKKESKSGNQNTKDDSGSKKPAIPEHEVRQESSKAADASMAAQKRAKELKEAAAGAGDPDERQKLMEQAIDAQIEAESFGKTAKYLRSGAFQGLAVGTGCGVAPGASLGAITGTLVGGVSSTLLGGLGGGIGAAAGAIHGPMWDVSKIAGKGIRKVTGDLPGWAASDEQKKSLEKMMGQVNEEVMPDESELKDYMEEGGGAKSDKSWLESAKDYMPPMPSMGVSDKSSKQEGEQQKDPKLGEHAKTKAKDEGHKKPRKLETKSTTENMESAKSSDTKKKPRKLDDRSTNKNTSSANPDNTKSQPQQLETSSA